MLVLSHGGNVYIRITSHELKNLLFVINYILLICSNLITRKWRSLAFLVVIGRFLILIFAIMDSPILN